jgi:hypothetical protein
VPNEMRQKVRFTGKRTGLERLAIKSFGLVEVGDIIEVDGDVAERWLQELPTADGKTASDFAAVEPSDEHSDAEEDDQPFVAPEADEMAEADEADEEDEADETTVKGKKAENPARSRPIPTRSSS